MNYGLDQQNPIGLSYKSNVLSLEECRKLAQLFHVLKFQEVENKVNHLDYGYVYDTDKNFKFTKKIPKYLRNFFKSIISRMNIDMDVINHCVVEEYSNYQCMRQHVDPINLGHKTIMFIIGNPVLFKMVNLKNARSKFENVMQNGTCIFFEEDSRFFWTHQTLPSMGKRWIVTMRSIEIKEEYVKKN